MAAPWKTKLATVVAFSLEAAWSWCLLHLLIGVAGNQYDEFEGFLLCRKCGYEIAKAKDLISIPSKLALRQRNDSIANSQHVLIQLFQNPNDIYFELITSTEAEIEKSSQKFAQGSWFPGYAWSIANCPRCGTHIGWVFDAVGYVTDAVKAPVASFVGLVFDKIMHEDEVNNLIAMPKVYAS